MARVHEQAWASLNRLFLLIGLLEERGRPAARKERGPKRTFFPQPTEIEKVLGPRQACHPLATRPTKDGTSG